MKKDFNFEELGKGILIVLSYYIGMNLLSHYVASLLIKYKLPSSYLYTFFLYIFVLSILIVIYRSQLITSFKDFKKNFKKHLPKAFEHWIKGFFIMIVSNLILVYIFHLNKSINESMNIELLKSNLLLHSLLILIVAPFLEEIVFRLSFGKMTNNTKIYSIITGVLFGFVHIISSFSAYKYMTLLLLIPYSSMGIALGYAYKDTNNICSSLCMHMLHNLLSWSIIIISIKGGII